MNDTHRASAVAADGGENPFFQGWTGAFGVPAFGRIRPEHFRPAYQQGFAEHLAEVETIAGNPAPPSFDNTIVALERSGRAQAAHRSVPTNEQTMIWSERPVVDHGGPSAFGIRG